VIFCALALHTKLGWRFLLKAMILFHNLLTYFQILHVDPKQSLGVLKWHEKWKKIQACVHCQITHSQFMLIPAYQLLVYGRWFSLGTLSSSTTKTGCHDIAEILLKVALKGNKSINQHSYSILFSFFMSFQHTKTLLWIYMKYLKICQQIVRQCTQACMTYLVMSISSYGLGESSFIII
jgi:hypothetical protein